MSEERAVQQVLPKYVRGADARDGAAVAALFTEAGRVEVRQVQATNRYDAVEMIRASGQLEERRVATQSD
jgi:hypothetical protein